MGPNLFVTFKNFMCPWLGSVLITTGRAAPFIDPGPPLQDSVSPRPQLGPRPDVVYAGGTREGIIRAARVPTGLVDIAGIAEGDAQIDAQTGRVYGKTPRKANSLRGARHMHGVLDTFGIAPRADDNDMSAARQELAVTCCASSVSTLQRLRFRP